MVVGSWGFSRPVWSPRVLNGFPLGREPWTWGYNVKETLAAVVVVGCVIAAVAHDPGTSGSSVRTTTASSCAQTLVEYGERSSCAREAQSLLRLRGHYNGAVDGAFGRDSRAATVAFQKARGLRADGVVGPSTWAELKR